jgi:hypothetical protein
VITTNDNLNARPFFERRGFRVYACPISAVDDARKIKPPMPVIGNYQLELQAELDIG